MATNRGHRLGASVVGAVVEDDVGRVAADAGFERMDCDY